MNNWEWSFLCDIKYIPVYFTNGVFLFLGSPRWEEAGRGEGRGGGRGGLGGGVGGGEGWGEGRGGGRGGVGRGEGWGEGRGGGRGRGRHASRITQLSDHHYISGTTNIWLLASAMTRLNMG